MKQIAIYRHNAGNNSVEQVMNAGKECFNGNALEVKREILRLRKQAKESYLNTSTDMKLNEFVSDYMSKYYFVDIKNHSWYY